MPTTCLQLRFISDFLAFVEKSFQFYFYLFFCRELGGRRRENVKGGRDSGKTTVARIWPEITQKRSLNLTALEPATVEATNACASHCLNWRYAHSLSRNRKDERQTMKKKNNKREMNNLSDDRPRLAREQLDFAEVNGMKSKIDATTIEWMNQL